MHGLKHQILVILLMTAFVAVHFGKLLIAPNDHLIAGRDDGIKNYFVVASYVKNSEDFGQIQSMNYPFGEFLLLEDAHPALAVVLKVISVVFPGIANYVVGIINFLLLASLIIGAWVMFHIFRHFRVRVVLAVMGSIAIPAFSSQILLWGYGHWALGYVCFFPLGWLLMIRLLHSSKPGLWLWLTGFNTLFWMFIHPYLGLILLMFNIVVLVVAHLNRINNQGQWKKYLVAFFLPLIIYVLVVKLADPHTDRPEGFFMDQHVASWRSILFSTETFTSSIAFALDVFSSATSWDRVGNYIGLSTILVLFVYSHFLIIRLILRHTSVQRLLRSEWTVYWSAATITLLFAMGLPFRFFPELNLGPFSVLMQFSGYGRFAWVFYFISTTFAVVVLSTYFSKNQYQRILSNVLLLLLLAESNAYAHKIDAHATEAKNMFKANHNVEGFAELLNQVQPENYQAVISLPFYYHYGNPYNFGSSAAGIFNSMLLSYHSGLPLMNTYLSRPSISEGRKIIQIFSPPVFTREIVAELSSTKPFLIYHTGEELLPREKRLLGRADSVASTEFGHLYTLTFDSVFDIAAAPEIALYEKIEPQLTSQGDLFAKPNTSFFYTSFEENSSAISFSGKGAYSAPNRGRSKVIQYTPQSLSGGKHELSLWYYNENNHQTFTNVELEITSPDGSVFSTYHNPFEGAFILGNWSLVTASFDLSENQSVAVFINADTPIRDSVYVDDLLIRNVESDLYQQISINGNDFLWKNNRLFEYTDDTRTSFY